jgi:hypothetical protein
MLMVDFCQKLAKATEKSAKITTKSAKCCLISNNFAFSNF